LVSQASILDFSIERKQNWVTSILRVGPQQVVVSAAGATSKIKWVNNIATLIDALTITIWGWTTIGAKVARSHVLHKPTVAANIVPLQKIIVQSVNSEPIAITTSAASVHTAAHVQLDNTVLGADWNITEIIRRGVVCASSVLTASTNPVMDSGMKDVSHARRENTPAMTGRPRAINVSPATM
jgi:hypothetical protein